MPLSIIFPVFCPQIWSITLKEQFFFQGSNVYEITRQLTAAYHSLTQSMDVIL